MHKTTKLMSLALGALGLVSSLTACSNEEYGDAANVMDGAVKQIGYTAGMNGVTASRATAITGSNYLNTDLVPSMRVWGYFAHNAAEGAGIVAGGQYVGASGNSITIDNHSQGATADWQYNNLDDQAYWPKQPLNFYSVIGANDTKVVTSMSSTVGANKLAHVVADVTIPENNADQKDVMFAKSVNQTREFKAAGIDPVDFKFYHALSQIVFSGKCAAKKISADVQSVTICNADSKGRVGYLTDNGSDVTLGAELATTRGYGKFAAGLIASATLNGIDNMTTAKNLTAADGALMLLPQTGATKWATVPGTPVTIAAADAAHQTYLKISCKIKNDNVYLIGDASSYGDVYIPFTIDWEQGKKYTYTLIFGAGVGGYDVDGKPLDSMLPITYTVSAPEEWNEVDGGIVPDAESEAQLAAIAELEAYALDIISKGGDPISVNTELSNAIKNVSKASDADVNSTKEDGFDCMYQYGPHHPIELYVDNNYIKRARSYDKLLQNKTYLTGLDDSNKRVCFIKHYNDIQFNKNYRSGDVTLIVKQYDLNKNLGYYCYIEGNTACAPTNIYNFQKNATLAIAVTQETFNRLEGPYFDLVE